MDCSVCSRDFNNKRKPVCASCAQATLYAPRLEHVSALLEREKQHTHVEAILRPGNDGVIAALPEDANYDAIGAGIRKHAVEKARDERKMVEARINDITEKADELRQQIEDYREWAAKQKETHVRRRAEVQTEYKQLERQRPRVLEPVQTATRKSQQRLEKVQNRTVDARMLLCREAARLAGLEKRRGAEGKTEYWLGGILIPDLRDLADKAIEIEETALGPAKVEPLVQPHEQYSAGLENVCRLLGSCCHYLSVRLPAEILLPHNGAPRARIMSDKCSYKRIGSPPASAHSSQTGIPPMANQQQDRSGRPRPLHLDRPLVHMVKEDNLAFQMYVEGVTYLAYDVAWLCKSQGLDKVTSFEDICAIGKNLYNLLLAQDVVARPPLSRNISSATTKTERNARASVPTVRLGAYSHASAHHSLAGPAANEIIRGWRLPPALRLADKLKAHFMNEFTGAEWDHVSDNEWHEERPEDGHVFVGGAARQSLDQAGGPAMSVMSLRPSDGADDEIGRREKSGWMKVRGRGAESIKAELILRPHRGDSTDLHVKDSSVDGYRISENDAGLPRA
ncbi:hypothetical protein LTR97_008179 [Elasticomyces elasticus]|uniref:Autophagy-related protein 14 n=1 Tax=Elasticomyces elasticus TaxID=574655 RepID=A0AAN7ZMQ9_9PEZI|nr:hypothetical protein LTR97_008179 [Elasticomyces elasticus]